MQIDRDVVLRLENLARLELSDSERDSMGHDLNNMLAMVQKLHELDTSGVAPLVYINEDTLPPRQDHVEATLSNTAALANAPETDGSFFSVPKVM